MTRWARSGNTQKHCKQPDDPTPWEDFVSQMHFKKKQESQKFKNGKIVKCSSNDKEKRNIQDLQESLKILKTEERKKFKIMLEMEETVILKKSNLEATRSKKSAHINANVRSDSITKVMTCVTEEKEQGKESDNIEQRILADVEKNTCLLSKGKKKKNKKKLPSSKILEYFDADINNSNAIDSSELISDVDTNERVEKRLQDNETSGKESLKKKRKEHFLEKRMQSRLNNGIILLPKKVEDKLYRIKKALRKKGLPGDEIKNIIRKKRREEELKFRNTRKICFNCREIGHVLADCPKVSTDQEQGTGICFKCGSTEHTSFKCQLKTSDFPYAKCFICKNMGHLSRNCPENKLGIYPKGGKCNLCGDVNHLMKDCPKLAKKKDDVEVTAHIIDEVVSVDMEILEAEPVVRHQKKVKVVKF